MGPVVGPSPGHYNGCQEQWAATGPRSIPTGQSMQGPMKQGLDPAQSPDTLPGGLAAQLETPRGSSPNATPRLGSEALMGRTLPGLRDAVWALLQIPLSKGLLSSAQG